MKIKNSQFLIIAAGVLLIAIIGYLLFQNSQLRQKLSPPTPLDVVLLDKTSTESETVNWKTYQSPDTLRKININFSLNYPTDWFVNEENPTNTSYVPNVIFSQDKVGNVMSRNSPCFSVLSGIWSVSNTADDLIKSEDSTQILSLNGTKTSTSPKVISVKNITINRMSGIARNIIKYGENQPSKQIFLKAALNHTYGSDGETFFIISSCPNTDDNIFNIILSTFKFTEQITPSTVEGPPSGEAGKFCGGIANIQCATGYRCRLDGSYPDAGGKCVTQ